MTNSIRTTAKAAIEYAKALYATFIPGTESWLDINNNRAFLAPAEPAQRL